MSKGQGILLPLFGCVIVLLSGHAYRASAQAPPGVFADATHPAGPPDPTKLDSIWQVDPLTGSVSITIPFATTPEGGRGPKIPFTLHYNSSSTVTLQSNGSTAIPNLANEAMGEGGAYGSEVLQWYDWSAVPIVRPSGPAGPWTTSGPFMYSTSSTVPNQNYTFTIGGTQTNVNEGTGCTIGGPYIYTDESGAAHDMNLEVFSNSGGSPMSPQCQNAYGANSQYGSVSTTTDGSAMATSLNYGQSIGIGNNPNVLHPDGTQFFQGGILEDSNGNKATLQSSGNVWSATDSLGRTAFQTTIPIGQQGQIPAGTYNVTTTGASGGSESYSVVFSTISLGSFTMPHPVGGPTATSEAQYTGVCLQSVSCPTNYGIMQVTAGSTVAQLPALTSISLPDNTQYGFTYDPTYGTISKIQFPTGGYVRFVWGIRADGGGHGEFLHLSTLVATDVYTSTGLGTENHWQYNVSFRQTCVTPFS